MLFSSNAAAAAAAAGQAAAAMHAFPVLSADGRPRHRGWEKKRVGVEN